MGAIADFYPNTSLRFQVTLKIDGTAQDISSDRVTFRMKRLKSDRDAKAVITSKANVTTSGASGIAKFEVQPNASRHLRPGTYHCDILWEIASNDRKFIAYDDRIALLHRVSDI